MTDAIHPENDPKTFITLSTKRDFEVAAASSANSANMLEEVKLEAQLDGDPIPEQYYLGIDHAIVFLRLRAHYFLNASKTVD